MSARRAGAGSSGGGRSAVVALAVIVVAVAMMMLLRARPDTQPFDPRSGKGDGTRGLVLLLQHYGADVQITRSIPPVGTPRRVLVVQDRLDDAQRRELAKVVEGGAMVVMADGRSPLAGTTEQHAIDATSTIPGLDPGVQINTPLGQCNIGAFGHLAGLHALGGVLLRVGAGERSCFGDGGTAFALARSTGKGVLVVLGDNSILTNQNLRFADNAGLATALLAPARGTRVSIVLGSQAPKTVADVGGGTRHLADLVRPGVWMALVQLAIAFVVLALARAIRPGRPVREPEQVPIAGSELVVATGRLMQRARHVQRAGWLLRDDLFRVLCDRYHLPHRTSVEDLDATVAARAGLAPGDISAVLHREITDQQQLLELSHRIREIKDLVLQGALQ